MHAEPSEASDFRRIGEDFYCTVDLADLEAGNPHENGQNVAWPKKLSLTIRAAAITMVSYSERMCITDLWQFTAP